MIKPHISAAAIQTDAEQNAAPLLHALLRYAVRNMLHLDVPGHKKRNNPELAAVLVNAL